MNASADLMTEMMTAVCETVPDPAAALKLRARRVAHLVWCVHRMHDGTYTRGRAREAAGLPRRKWAIVRAIPRGAPESALVVAVGRVIDS